MTARFILLLAVASVAACTDRGPTDISPRDPRFARNAGSDSVTVSSVRPSRSLRGVTLDVRVFGSGFDSTSTVQWAVDGVTTTDIVTNSTTVLSSRELVSNITISAEAEGTLYDVIVTSASGKPGIGTETFEVDVEMTLLGDLGGTYTVATGINEAGQIVGAGTTPNGTRAFLWTKGSIRNLGVPAGFTESRAEGINNRGQVVGYAMVNRNGTWQSRAFVWTRESGMQLLSGSDRSRAMGINDAGMIVGDARDSTGRHRVAVWVNGNITFLPREAFVAFDVNSRGQVVGTAAPCDEIGFGFWCSAYVWSRETGLQYVNALRGSWGEAIGINDNGEIVGWGPHATDDELVFGWVSRRGVAESLGFNGGPNSVGMKVASNGLIAGRGVGQGAVWTANGKMIVLPNPEETVWTEVFDVNSRGEAVGSVFYNERHGYETRAIRWRLY